MVYVFIYTVVYPPPSPLHNCLSQYPINILKLMPYKYSSYIGSFLPVDSYQDSVSTKYSTKMQVQKKYYIHNNNTVNASVKLKQKMCKSIHSSSSLEVLSKKTGYDSSLHNRIKCSSKP